MTADFTELGVRDHAAAGELVEVLRSALTELLAFGEAPILLAECPNKYNDIEFDDYWYAVQVGMSTWERSHHFRDASVPWATERTQFVDPKSGGPVPDCLFVSERIATARKVLQDLQSKRWRELIQRAFDSNKGNDALIGLIHCFGQPWVYRSRPNCGGGDTWTWDKNGQFYHVANAMDRLDKSVGSWYPLGTFYRIDVGRFTLLTKEAQQYFAPSIKDSASHDMLAAALSDAVGKIRYITSELVQFRLTVPYYQYARFIWKDQEFDARMNKPPTAIGEKLPVEVILLDKLLREMTKTKWRELFGAAYGQLLAPQQSLELFVTGDDAVMLRGNSAVRVAEGKLTFGGLCDWHCNRFPILKCQPV